MGDKNLDKKEKLEKLCQEAINNSDWKAEKVGRKLRTFCNIAVHHISQGLGCIELGGKLANKQIEYMRFATETWNPCDSEGAQAFANVGELVIGGKIKIGGHGHIVVIHPGGMIESGKWKKSVPMCCSIGKENGIMGVNWAFRKEPDYFLWIGGKVK